MKEESIDIELLAYNIKEAKSKGKGTIVFLGAGASKTAGIPTAKEIIADILNKRSYNKNPKIKALSPDEKKDYATVMACLQPHQRKELFANYINNSKVNVTHIYLAHLVKEGYVDYIFTPNFDDLMLKALGLFNIYPPVYDLAMLDTLNTTALDKQAVVYLHGRHNGIWQLNTLEEMSKVNGICSRLFNKVEDSPWLVIGYNGSDKIFDHICGLGRFNYGLYWVGLLDNDPSERVCTKLLDKENTNAYLLKGYDSDSFMIKLHNQLGIKEHPLVFDKPFSHLEALLSNIVDIGDKEEFRSVRERFDISKKHVKDAIGRYEKNKSGGKKLESDKLHKEILDLIATENFEENKVADLEKRIEGSGDAKARELLGNLAFSMAFKIKEKDEKSLLKKIDLYKKAAELNSNNSSVYNNLGIALFNLAKLKNDQQLYQEAIKEFEKAEELNPNNSSVYNNWGTALADLAKLKSDQQLYQKAINKYKKAEELNPNDSSIYYNWGTALADLAKLKSDQQLYQKAIEKFEKAAELDPNKSNIYYNWGTVLYELAKLKSDQQLYQKAINKYKKAEELNPNNSSVYNNWGLALADLAKLKSDQQLYQKAIEKYKKAEELGGRVYNLACAYALTNKKQEALDVLNKSFTRQEITVDDALADDDWEAYLSDLDFITLIDKYK